jgi:hypothetical protein
VNKTFDSNASGIKRDLMIPGSYDFNVRCILIIPQDIMKVLEKPPIDRKKRDILMLETEFEKFEFFKSIIQDQSHETFRQCLKLMRVEQFKQGQKIFDYGKYNNLNLKGTLVVHFILC